MKIDRKNFSGVLVPLITPFLGGEVDMDSLKHLCDHYLTMKADGLVVCGTTGESATLNKDEKHQIIQFIVDHYSERLPIIVGISAVATSVAIEEAKQLEEIGVDGLLVLSPPYVKPSQEGIYQYFKQVSTAVTIPTVIYNIPYRTGVNIEIDTVKCLSQLENIVAIKECSGDINQLMDTINQTDLKVFTGEDHLLLITAVLGGVGAISASAHICLAEMKQILADVEADNINAAREQFKQILGIIRLCFVEPNPAPIKAILQHQGLITSDEVRLPLIKATESIVAQYSKLI